MMNADFLKKEQVTHVVNTAKGLEIFGPKYTVSGFCLYSLVPRSSPLHPQSREFASLTALIFEFYVQIRRPGDEAIN